MSRTRWPTSARAAPRLTAVVVLPTPPFCMATAIVRAKSAPSLTEAERDRPRRDVEGDRPEGPTDIIRRGVPEPPHCGRGRSSLRGGCGQAVPETSQALPGDLGAGAGHVRRGGRVRNRRPAWRLVRCDLQGLLPLRRVAERRLAWNRFVSPSGRSPRGQGGRNRHGPHLVVMCHGRPDSPYQPSASEGPGAGSRRDRRSRRAAADHEPWWLAAADRGRGLVGVEGRPRWRAAKPCAWAWHPRGRRFGRRGRTQLRPNEGRLRRAAPERGARNPRDVHGLPGHRSSTRAHAIESEASVIFDAAIVLVILVALVLGYQRGVIQPLMAEIFFFGTLLVVFRFHDQYTTEMQKLLHINAVLSVFVALILAVILGSVGGAIGGAFHRLEAIRGVDGLLGIFVHVVVTVVVIYLAVSALVTLDNAFEPTLKSATLTLNQVNQLENFILSNPITSAMVSKSDLQALKTAAGKSTGASIDSVAGIHQLQQIYIDFLQPQLHSSHAVPVILSIGSHFPVIGHVGPTDLKPIPTPAPSPTPKVSPSPSPKHS